MSVEPDGELLKRFVQGDLEAFESLFKRFQGEVYGWILRIVRDTGAADDVLVDAFWRAYRGRARFDPSRSFGAWMRRIATNAARDQLRAARSRARWQAAAEDIPAPVGIDRDLAESVALALRSLPPKLQVVATLALIEERPYADIADALDVPVGTVKSRVFRATQMLRNELARLGIRP
jgi:RNA polymerase sigma-70 factor (ECF subfamily)